MTGTPYSEAELVLAGEGDGGSNIRRRLDCHRVATPLGSVGSEPSRRVIGARLVPEREWVSQTSELRCTFATRGVSTTGRMGIVDLHQSFSKEARQCGRIRWVDVSGHVISLSDLEPMSPVGCAACTVGNRIRGSSFVASSWGVRDR